MNNKFADDFSHKMIIEELETRQLFSGGLDGLIAPTATNLNVAETYTEDSTLNLTDIRISEVDSATATLTLSNVAAGSLNTGTTDSATSTFVAGVWTASGATDDVNNLLTGLTFTPAANFNSDFTIITRVSDGSLSVSGTKAMTGTAVNDAPLASGGATLSPALEDTLSPGGAKVSSLFSGNFSDLADSGNSDQNQFAGVGVRGQTVNIAKGRWQYSTDNSTNWSNFGAISDTHSLGLRLDDSLRFLPAANYHGTPNNLTVRLIDNSVLFTSGATVNMSTRGGTSAFSIATVAISTSITPVADTPSITSVTTSEDSQSTSALVISRNAVDSIEVTNFKITCITNGTLYKNDGTTPITNGMFISFAEGNAGLKFSPTANFNGNGSFTIQASTSSDNTGLGGSLVNASIIVTPVNDAPSATHLNATDSYTENTVLNLTTIVVSDIDSANITATLTLSDLAAGSLNTASSGAVTSTYADGIWSASGAITDVNTLLSGLTFTPRLNFNSDFTIATRISDGLAAVVVGSKSITGIAVNKAPVLAAIGNRVVKVGEKLSFTATAMDADLPAETLIFSLNPGALALGMSINANTGAFSWTPSASQGGISPSVTVTVTDSGAKPLVDSETFTINVANSSIEHQVDSGTVTVTVTVTVATVNNPPPTAVTGTPPPTAVTETKTTTGTVVKEPPTGVVSITPTTLLNPSLSVSKKVSVSATDTKTIAPVEIIRKLAPPVIDNITVITPVALGTPQGSFNNMPVIKNHSANHVEVIAIGKANVFDDGKVYLNKVSVINSYSDITVDQQTVTTATKSAGHNGSRLASAKPDYTVDMDHLLTQSEEQALWQHLETLRKQIDATEFKEINVHVVPTLTLTAAIVSWALGSESLFACLRSSPPLKAILSTIGRR